MRMVVSPLDPACDSTAAALVDNVTPGAMLVVTACSRGADAARGVRVVALVCSGPDD